MTGSASFTRHAALVSILLPGAIGLGVVARTLLFYAGHDAAASLLVALMAIGLLFGLAELVARQRRVLAIADELAGLPPTLTESQLERLGTDLRQLLRARIEHAPAALFGESVAPYLVGLLVMLGLLGTLLGLFETLSGAGHALTASANVDALRSGLSGPMRGLTRSFGCSAAGVSASVMLGLAAALVRRREARALAAVHAYANGPLRELSPLRRQASALSQLANQGDALPKAAAALELAAERLGGLSERWETAHRAATAAQHQALEQAMRGLRAELTRTAGEVGRELKASLAKQLESMLTSTGSALSQHIGQAARVIEQDGAARRESDAALRESLRSELTTLLQSTGSALSQHIGQAARVIEQDGAARRESDAALRESLRDELTTLLQSTGSALSEHIGQAARVIEQDGAARRESDAALRESLRSELTTLQQAIARDGARQSELSQAQLTSLEAAGKGLGQLAESVSEQLRARLTVVDALTDRSQQAMALLERSGGALESALGRHDSAVEALVGHAREQLGRLQEAATEGTLAAVERVVALTSAQSERLAHFESQLQLGQEAHGKGLSEQLGTHAAQLSKGLEGTGELVREAANLLKSSSVELGAVAETFAHSVERQREAASTWLESLGELEGAVERAGRGAAADALGDQLASTQEVFARQLQFQRELFEQLRSLRTPPAPSVHGERDVSA